MLKILLVYDDFQELTSVESTLRKIGFDVVGITSEFSLAEQLLSFNPQVVVAQGKAAKVSTANVGRRLRESLRWEGKSILIFHSQNKPQPLELLRIRMDVGLEYPVEPTRLVQSIAQMGNLDATHLLDKLIKNMAQESAAAAAAQTQFGRGETQSVFVSGGGGANSEGGKTSTAVGGAAQVNQVTSTIGSETVELQAKGSVIGGTGNATSHQNVMGPSGATDPQQNQALKGNDQSESEMGPLFPLSNPTGETAAQGVRGSGASSDSALNLKGNLDPAANSLDLKNNQEAQQNPLDVKGLKGSGEAASDVKGAGQTPNLFQLNGMPQDPLMRELESLLQPQKPQVNLPITVEDPSRRKKYEEILRTIPLQKMSSIKRREAKLRLKDLIRDMDKTELEDQDVSRRKFVKALFKKEG